MWLKRKIIDFQEWAKPSFHKFNYWFVCKYDSPYLLISCLFFMFFFTLPNCFFCFLLSFWPFFLFFFSQRISGFSTPVFTSEEVYMKVFTLQDKVLFPFPFLWKVNTYIAYNLYLYVFNTLQLTFNWYLCRF